ncbi:transcription repressor OFP1-like [Apium graveolens]|uniref:transcription repressor OFP1-like n=1 Tax=Apium graveolens TaxID=4045 RepID=UPI003D7B7BEF
MGNYKFKFSDMIPNAWFYKLRNMSSRTKNDNTMQKSKKKSHTRTKSPTFSSSVSPSSGGVAAALSPQPHHQRKSYHFTRDLPPTPDNNLASQLLDQPRKSSRKRRSIKKNRPSIRSTTSPRLLFNTSVSTDCSCRASLDEHHNNNPTDSCSSEETDRSVFPSENGDKPFDIMVSSCHCRVKSDIPVGMTMPKDSKLETFDSVSQFELRPIITKTNKIDKNDVEVSKIRTSHSSLQEKRSVNSVKRLSNASPGVKLRTNSPRIASKRFVQAHHRKSVSSGVIARRSLAESFAVVKTSQDPHRDFKDSMVEMIMEYNIRTSKDLEDLLACYLSLNSDKYHELIIKVFKQIWFEITDIRFK